MLIDIYDRKGDFILSEINKGSMRLWFIILKFFINFSKFSLNRALKTFSQVPYLKYISLMLLYLLGKILSLKYGSRAFQCFCIQVGFKMSIFAKC